MEKDRHLDRIFALVVIFVVGYYLANVFLFSARPPAVEKRDDRLLDAKTGQPISDEEISRITERQEKARRTYVLTGKVIAKLRDSLQIEIPINGKIDFFQLKFSPKMVFLAEVPLEAYKNNSSATEEREISFTEVKVGDAVTVVFPNGIVLGELNRTEAIEISNLIVNMPQKAVFGED